MTITKEEAQRIYGEICLNGELLIVITGRIKTLRYYYEGFTYDFKFIDNQLKKIEAFNHRELIENYVE